MKRTKIAFLILSGIVILTMLTCCNTRDNDQFEFDSSELKRYLSLNSIDYHVNEEEKNGLTVSYGGNIQIEIQFIRSSYSIHVTKESGKTFDEGEIKLISEIISLISKRNISIDDIQDLIVNEKYAKKESESNLNGNFVHIRLFDFWQNYTGEYGKIDTVFYLTLTGLLKK